MHHRVIRNDFFNDMRHFFTKINLGIIKAETREWHLPGNICWRLEIGEHSHLRLVRGKTGAAAEIGKINHGGSFDDMDDFDEPGASQESAPSAESAPGGVLPSQESFQTSVESTSERTADSSSSSLGSTVVSSDGAIAFKYGSLTPPASLG